MSEPESSETGPPPTSRKAETDEAAAVRAKPLPSTAAELLAERSDLEALLERTQREIRRLEALEILDEGDDNVGALKRRVERAQHDETRALDLLIQVLGKDTILRENGEDWLVEAVRADAQRWGPQPRPKPRSQLRRRPKLPDRLGGYYDVMGIPH